MIHAMIAAINKGYPGLAPSAIFHKSRKGRQTFSVTAPSTVGVWKIYVYAFAGHNNVGIKSASFGVIK